jgi:hypothetical protein
MVLSRAVKVVKRWAVLDTLVTVHFWHLVDTMLQAVVALENLNGPLSIIATSSDVTGEAVDDFISTLFGSMGGDVPGQEHQSEPCSDSDQ